MEIERILLILIKLYGKLSLAMRVLYECIREVRNSWRERVTQEFRDTKIINLLGKCKYKQEA